MSRIGCSHPQSVVCTNSTSFQLELTLKVMLSSRGLDHPCGFESDESHSMTCAASLHGNRSFGNQPLANVDH